MPTTEIENLRRREWWRFVPRDPDWTSLPLRTKRGKSWPILHWAEGVRTRRSYPHAYGMSEQWHPRPRKPSSLPVRPARRPTPSLWKMHVHSVRRLLASETSTSLGALSRIVTKNGRKTPDERYVYDRLMQVIVSRPALDDHSIAVALGCSERSLRRMRVRQKERDMAQPETTTVIRHEHHHVHEVHLTVVQEQPSVTTRSADELPANVIRFPVERRRQAA